MAAKLALIMLILTVKSKSWVLENKFANVQYLIFFYIICIIKSLNSFWKVS